MRRMGEHITDQCHDRAQCHLPADGIPGAVHLEEKRNGDDRADSAANRRENDVIETERIEILPRAITRRQASHAPPNFSAAERPRPPTRSSSDASRFRFSVVIHSPSFNAAQCSDRDPWSFGD
jgi:hypothetical protein